ncbi:MAG: hypothetical protein UV78_C0045G0009 [Parcubacteria group bacterium GW2011_GWA2_43_17]|nr:MAG: hypothetical protein UV78_C0045G0009 [Parcubacteria group bacterium GW2011_GWA2_43_17]
MNFLVAGAGLEPATCRLWACRAANCSTPRRIALNTSLFAHLCQSFDLIFSVFGFIKILIGFAISKLYRKFIFSELATMPTFVVLDSFFKFPVNPT